MAFITVAGENQIAAKQGAAQILDITHFVLANIAGLGAEPVNRIEAMPAGGDIMATLPVTAHGYVNGNQVVYSLVMDSSLGDYDFNWVGLKDADGVLIACTYVPLIQKRKTTGAIPGNNLTRNFLIAFSGIQATTAIDVPAATWQIDFNARLWGIDERERLSNYDNYGHEAFLSTGWNVQRVGATTTYDVLPGVGYVGGVRIASAITQQVTVAGPPKSVWLDVSLQGDISDVSAVVAFIVDAVAHTDYTDGLGFKHFVTKIAAIAADGSVLDLRQSADNINKAGEVVYFARATAPEGYLKTNGAAISRTAYARLFAAIGTVFGAGDGSTTFALPDLRGEFLRGWDDSRGVDAGRLIGLAQADSLQSHSHDINSGWGSKGSWSGAGTLYGTTLGRLSEGDSVENFGATDAYGSTETRPRNVALLACIKY